MFRWLIVCVILCGGAFAAVSYGVPYAQSHGWIPAPEAAAEEGEVQEAVVATKPVENFRVEPVANAKVANKSISIQDGRLLVTDKQEVASERNGQLVVIATEALPGEKVPAGRRITAKVGFLAIALRPREQVAENQTIKFQGINRLYRRWREGDPFKDPTPAAAKKETDEKTDQFLIVAEEVREFRRLFVGDEVKAGQMVALVDPSLAIREMAIKNSTVLSADADVLASVKTKEEYYRRFIAMEDSNRRSPGTHSRDDIESARLQWQRYAQEQVSKEMAVIKSQQELLQAITILGKQEVRAAIDGVIKIIYKNQGDAVKELEPILQIQNPRRLRLEALIEKQDTYGLRPGTEVIVEPSRPERPHVLRGHLLDVTCVAVSAGPKPIIVSGSEDKTLRGWDPETEKQIWQLTHKVPVRAVACTPLGSKNNLVLAGWADGVGRLIDLDNLQDLPRELKERHRSAITCVAFSPDGALCATGGEDRAICLWDAATGDLRGRLTHAHRAAVTSIQFAGGNQLVSAGRDNAMVLWNLGEGNQLIKKDHEFDRRSGDVGQLGVSPDGKCVLFDQGKELRLLSLADRQIEGVVQNASGSTSFTTMALFAPDGKTILTNVAAEGRIQLWRAPNAEQPRAAELRQLIWTSGQATCGAFSPDGRFAVTGTQDNRVLIWPMPSPEEISQKLTAKLTLVEASLESSSRQVRIWAELDNPLVDDPSKPGEKQLLLLPGGTATMVVMPQR